MKILQVHNRYREPGGEDRVVDEERALLSAAGHEVRTLDAQNPDSAPQAAMALAASPWNLAAGLRASQMIRDFRPDIVHVHNTWFSFSPSVVSKVHRLGYPVVMTLHNYRLTCANAVLFRDGEPCRLCLDGSAWNGVRHACYRRSRLQSGIAVLGTALQHSSGVWGGSVDRFLTLTDFARSIFIEAGLPRERLTVKPNFTRDPGPRITAPSTSDTVLYVGRITEEKGIAVLLKAWQQYKGPLRLTVVGDGPTRRQYEAMAPANVTFAGLLDRLDVARRMLDARALVFPTLLFEGQPMSLVEALGAGLPSLVSDSPGLRETLGDSGFFFRPDDAGELLDAIRGLEDGGAIDSRGTEARRIYEMRHHPLAALTAYEQIYEAVAS